MPSIETRDLTKEFGSLVAVDNVTFSMETGGIYGIIGPNGAGKTTFIRCLTGTYAPSSGEILHNGDDIAGMADFEIARRGIATAEQLVNIYPEITLYDNVATAFHWDRDERIWDALLHTGRHSTERVEVESGVREHLSSVGLDDRADEPAENLAYGQKKRLMIAMAMATDPEFLVLDEPVAGLNPEESSRLMEILHNLLAERDLGILLIEHDMEVVMNNCDQIMVLANGAKIAEGSPETIQQDEQVQEAYLG